MGNSISKSGVGRNKPAPAGVSGKLTEAGYCRVECRKRSLHDLIPAYFHANIEDYSPGVPNDLDKIVGVCRRGGDV